MLLIGGIRTDAEVRVYPQLLLRAGDPGVVLDLMELPVLCYEFGILELAGMGSTKTFAVPAVVHRVTVVGTGNCRGASVVCGD